MFWHDDAPLTLLLGWDASLSILAVQDLKADFAEALDNAKPVVVKASVQADFNLISSHQGVDQIIG